MTSVEVIPVNKVNKYANLHLNNCGGGLTHDDIFFYIFIFEKNEVFLI